MDFEHGYRLRVTGLDGLAKLVTAYRAHALRIMAGSYADQIARTAVSALDASCVGLVQNRGDILSQARESVRSAHDKLTDGVYAASLNCRIEFHFVGNAILAVLVHGSERYRKPWEARKEVVRWGWSPSLQRPTHIGEAAWADRARYWSEISRPSAVGYGVFSFCLLQNRLPGLGWNALSKCMPSLEWRVEQCVRKLASAERIDPAAISQRDRERFEGRARSSIISEVDEASFSLKLPMNRMPEGQKPRERAQVPSPTAPQKDTKKVQKEELASIVDHADIVVAADGRAFMAIPHVGFRTEDRVHIQIGTKDIVFSQNGIQYGTVTKVPASSRDYLRGLTSITLVEVREVDGKRLLRAKHTAMVSDISLGEGVRRPLQTFRKRSREAGIQEI